MAKIDWKRMCACFHCHNACQKGERSENDRTVGCRRAGNRLSLYYRLINEGIKQQLAACTRRAYCRIA
ncbi:hypothetical protein KCP71_11230 [Salmonella enterica subsp. enterica]|nr:hypothetical protein KCP71_11230 [Salmonella enterica subsp. enterica]